MPSHLYVHIPFCHRICPYCAFFKHTPGRTDMRGFVEGLIREAELRLPEGYAPETIYFGGGTPSMLSPTHLGRLVEGLRRRLDLSGLREWSFEANPATFHAAKAAQWAALGITRVSLGAQSFEPELLHVLGREHSAEQIAESVRLLREAGIAQVNLDLMFSLPGQSLEQWRHSLEAALELAPDHISTYNLTYEEDTAFFDAYGARGGDEERDAAMFELADDLLTAAGMRHYEISNYARPGCESLHNFATWRGEDYHGLGPGAYGTVEGVRYHNGEDTAAYIAALAQGHLPPGEQEQLTPEQRRTEMLGLRLRTDEGLPADFLRPQDADFTRMLQREGLAEFNEAGALRLTRSGRLVADEVALGLM